LPPKKDKEKDEENKSHLFWDNQPVPKLSETIADEGTAIDKEKTIAEVRQIPYALPEGFEWSDIEVNDEKSIKEVYTLLNENYVEDDDNMFRFDYSIDFLRWYKFKIQNLTYLGLCNLLATIKRGMLG